MNKLKSMLLLVAAGVFILSTPSNSHRVSVDEDELPPTINSEAISGSV